MYKAPFFYDIRLGTYCVMLTYVGLPGLGSK